MDAIGVTSTDATCVSVVMEKERASDAVHLYNTSVDGRHTVDDMGARRVSDDYYKCKHYEKVLRL